VLFDVEFPPIADPPVTGPPVAPGPVADPPATGPPVADPPCCAYTLKADDILSTNKTIEIVINDIPNVLVNIAFIINGLTLDVIFSINIFYIIFIYIYINVNKYIKYRIIIYNEITELAIYQTRKLILMEWKYEHRAIFC
jgi:hypothetical protein